MYAYAMGGMQIDMQHPLIQRLDDTITWVQKFGIQNDAIIV